MDWSLLLSFTAGMFAILNPIGNLPVFIGVTRGMRSGVRSAVAVLVCAVIALGLILFLFSGQAILRFFGISLAAFQIAGGVLLLLLGLGMVRGEPHTLRAEVAPHPTDGKKTGFREDFKEAEAGLSDVLVPVGIPLFVGPGSMSTVVLYAAKADATTHQTANMTGMAIILVLLSVVTLAILLASNWIARLLGRNGLDIATRVLGLIITAIGVEFMLSGLAAVTTIFDASKVGP